MIKSSPKSYYLGPVHADLLLLLLNTESPCHLSTICITNNYLFRQ